MRVIKACVGVSVDMYRTTDRWIKDDVFRFAPGELAVELDRVEGRVSSSDVWSLVLARGTIGFVWTDYFDGACS